MNSKANHRCYLIEFNPNATLVRAVTYARKLIDAGTPPESANSQAAAFYRVSVTDVAHYTSPPHKQHK